MLVGSRPQGYVEEEKENHFELADGASPPGHSNEKFKNTIR
jgi:hypothetical protein